MKPSLIQQLLWWGQPLSHQCTPKRCSLQIEVSGERGVGRVHWAKTFNNCSIFHESARKTWELLVSSIFLFTAYLGYTPLLRDLAIVVSPFTTWVGNPMPYFGTSVPWKNWKRTRWSTQISMPSSFFSKAFKYMWMRLDI